MSLGSSVYDLGVKVQGSGFGGGGGGGVAFRVKVSSLGFGVTRHETQVLGHDEFAQTFQS